MGARATGLALPHRTPETRTRLVPLTSLWLDMLVLRLMNLGQPSRRPVWFILDELASLQRLPQLHTAVTENRKSNNPVVLGFQGRSQLETRYGHDAEAMLSQPATKIFLRTSEPHAAKWIADTIGDVEIERLRESRSSGQYGQRSFGLERQVEPLVMASEIGGLPPLRGYLKLGIWWFACTCHSSNCRAPSAFIERPCQDVTTPTLPAAAPAESSRRRHQRLAETAMPTNAAVAAVRCKSLLPIAAADADNFQALERGTGEAVSRGRVPDARENYYAEGERIRGVWHGSSPPSGD